MRYTKEVLQEVMKERAKKKVINVKIIATWSSIFKWYYMIL